MASDKPNDVIREAPAFPLVVEHVGEKTVFSGMSLRDYFAAKVLAAQVVASDGDYENEVIARSSYALADAMLKARSTK